MKILTKWVSLLVLVAAIALAGKSPVLAADKLVLGMPVRPPVMVHMPVFYALDNGIFELNGLKVEIKFFRGGVATHRAAASGKSGLDVSWVPFGIGLVGIAKGSGLKYFHSMSFLQEAIVTGAPGIDVPAKLKGKTIGIEGRGGYSHTNAVALLRSAGLTDNDVKWIKTPPPARVPFLLKGKADAVVIHVEQVLLSQKSKAVTVLGEQWKVMPKNVYGAFIAPASKLASNRDAYVRFAQSMIQANRSIYKDKEGFVRSALKWVRPVYKKNPDVISKTYDIFVKERMWSVNSGLPKAHVAWTANFMQKLGKIKGKVPGYADLIDVGIANESLGRLGKITPSEN